MKHLLLEYLGKILESATYKAVKIDGDEPRVVTFFKKDSYQEKLRDTGKYRPYNPATDAGLKAAKPLAPKAAVQVPKGGTVQVAPPKFAAGPAAPKAAKPANAPADAAPKKGLQSVVTATTHKELFSALNALRIAESRLMVDQGIAGAGGPVASTGETLCANYQTELINSDAGFLPPTEHIQAWMKKIDIGLASTSKRVKTTLIKNLDTTAQKFGLFHDDGTVNYDDAKKIMATAEAFVEKEDKEFKNTYAAKKFFKTAEDRASWLRTAFYSAQSLVDNGPSDWNKSNGVVLKANTVTDEVILQRLTAKRDAAVTPDEKEHFERELGFWDKFKGYHDTYLTYVNDKGFESIYHISNKKNDSMEDPQHNTTPEFRILVFTQAARSANLPSSSAKIIHDAETEGIAATRDMNAIVVKRIADLTPDTISLMASLATRLPARSQTDASAKYIKLLANSIHIRNAAKSDPSIDLSNPEHVIYTAIQFADKMPNDLLNHFSRFLLKVGQLANSVISKKEAGKSPAEISSILEGIYSPEEVASMLEDPVFVSFAKTKKIHAAGLAGIHEKFIDSLYAADNTSSENILQDNGPAIQTYVRGTLSALHMDTYIMNSDGKIQLEAGGFGVTPPDFRSSMKELSNYRGDIDTPEGRKGLIEHLAKRIKLDSNSEAIYLVGQDGKSRTYIVKDEWRQAGAAKKVTTSYGSSSIAAFKSSVATRNKKLRDSKSK